MDAKAIESKSKLLQKAVQSGEPTDSIISILRELQRGVKPTEDLLRSTRVGIIVNKLKQHKTAEVSRLASEIVSRWRNEVNKQKANGGGAASATSSRQGTASPKPTTGINSDEKLDKSTVPPEKRTIDADGISSAITGNDVRNKCIGLMYNGLCYNSSETPRLILQKATDIEAAAYKCLGGDKSPQYRTKLRSLFQNLKSKSNPGLKVRVLSSEVTPEEFVKMSHEELMSAERRAQEERLRKENMNNAMVAKQERSISTSLQCGKCGQRKVTYTEAQTRSADEPMTLFCTCLNCGKSWRQ